jgi:hypothetical protein
MEGGLRPDRQEIGCSLAAGAVQCGIESATEPVMTLGLRISTSIACGLLAMAAVSAARAAPAVVPIIYEEARVYVPVSAPRGPQEWFILDTGAPDVLIDSHSAAAVGLKVKAAGGIEGVGRGQLTVGAATGVMLRVGQTSLGPTDVTVAPINNLLAPYIGRTIGGVIGTPFFSDHVVSVDFAENRLELRDPAKAYDGPGRRLPFHFVDGFLVVQGAITLADGATLPARLVVDLGAKANLLVTEPFIARNHLLTRLGPLVVEPLGAGVGGETRYAFVRLPRLQVGPHNELSASDLVVGLSLKGTLRSDDYDGLLGAAFMQHYRVTFDYARHEITFEPNPKARPDAFDRSGAFVVADLNDLHRFTIHDIAAGSPAAEAGLAVGDVLTDIAARPARDYTLTEVSRAFAATDNAAVPVDVERDGRPVQATLHLRALL